MQQNATSRSVRQSELRKLAPMFLSDLDERNERVTGTRGTGMSRMLGMALPAAALVVIGAVGASVLGIGVASGTLAAKTKKPPPVVLYANVDQAGDLGSHYGAVHAKLHQPDQQSTSYTVRFDRPIGSCAATAQPGYAGGSLQAGHYISEVVYDPTNPKAFNVTFEDPAGDFSEPTASAFMMTVTCPKS